MKPLRGLALAECSQGVGGGDDQLGGPEDHLDDHLDQPGERLDDHLDQPDDHLDQPGERLGQPPQHGRLTHLRSSRVYKIENG